MGKKVDHIIKFFTTDIWRISQDDVSPVKFLFLEIAKKLLLAVRFFTAKRVMQKASALTYSTLLAIVPIMAVVFAIARGFGYSKYIEVWFRDAFESQPQVAEVIIGFVNSYLVHTKSGVFLGIGLLFMLYTVLMLVSNVEDAFNEIWQVKKPRSIFRTFTDYLAMFFLFPIIIVLTSGISIFMANIADLIAGAHTAFHDRPDTISVDVGHVYRSLHLHAQYPCEAYQCFLPRYLGRFRHAGITDYLHPFADIPV